MNSLKLNEEMGFTIIELLVVVAITGILVAIAIPQFNAYRRKSYESHVKSDLRNAAAAEEAYFAANLTYISGTLNSNTPTGFRKTPGVTLSAAIGSSTFQLTASHAMCGSTTWTYSSSSGAISGGPCL
ncbi:MAG: prepilin-type N-terminal cleavage/methylation domain-containing protein [Deltaproteobacteria bacterium]|nr:prepilin-type N-terminal cleavage/methylation domain-containing protein [Deltaproteobacteria bacterium]